MTFLRGLRSRLIVEKCVGLCVSRVWLKESTASVRPLVALPRLLRVALKVSSVMAVNIGA